MYYCTDQTSSNRYGKRYGFQPLFRNLSLHAFRPTGAWKRWPIIWGISPKAGCRIQLPHKHLRKLLLIVLLTVATQPRQSVTSTSLGESRIWRLKSPLMMSKTGDIFGSGKPAHSLVDSLSGLERCPIDGLKTGVFLVYNTLFTVLGALIAFLVLVAVLIPGLMLWRFAQRNPTMERNSQMAWAATHVPVQLYLHPKRLTNTITLPCHPERSEGSRCPSREIMSAAKDDRGCAPLQPRSGQPLRDS